MGSNGNSEVRAVRPGGGIAIPALSARGERSLVADAWVEPSVELVDREVDQHEQHGAAARSPTPHVVALQDGGDREAADAGTTRRSSL
jgi:hypothetical protein